MPYTDTDTSLHAATPPTPKKKKKNQIDLSKRGNTEIKGWLYNENMLMGRLLMHAGGEAPGGNGSLRVFV